MNNVYVCMQGPGVLFRSALTVCFSFAAGSTEARLKLDPVDIPVAWMFGLQEHPPLTMNMPTFILLPSAASQALTVF